MLKKQAPFLIFTLAIMIGLTVPVLIQDGMFMDAMLYTSVAHNLSQDIGTFWFPQFSKYNVSNQLAFHEQPPLGFWIISLFFRLFGDSMYVERGYTFLMLILTAFLIHRLWRRIYADHDNKFLSWLPVLIWITIPQVFWSFSNNMLENTMGVFILSGAIFIYDACRTEKLKIIQLIAGGVFIFLASLTKGLPGLFILAIPGLLWLLTKRINFRQSVIATILLLLVIGSIYALLLIDPVSRESLRIYFFDRAIFRIGENPTVNSRFFILGSLLQQVSGQVIFCIIIYVIGSVKKIQLPVKADKQLALFFIATGICGSLPLMLTLVQKAFYYVPSLPFFAIGFAILIAPVIKVWVDGIVASVKKYNLAMIISCILLIASVSYSVGQIGKTGRNREILEDVHAMGKIITDHTCVTLEQSLWNDWQLKTYMMRNYNICLDPREEHEYYVAESKSTPKYDDYTKLVRRGKKYDLYSKEK